MSDLIGWLATAIFGISYFVRSPVTMRWVQAGAAMCWIVYGVRLHAFPVIAANLIVSHAGHRFISTLGPTTSRDSATRRVPGSWRFAFPAVRMRCAARVSP